jgi:NAD(P)-dependent dehydrogenase (short-subunit alcohol dehydrogenase family)
MNLEELNSFYDFSNRTVLITGGAGVLGGEIACALAGCNANVVSLTATRTRAKGHRAIPQNDQRMCHTRLW